MYFNHLVCVKYRCGWKALRSWRSLLPVLTKPDITLTEGGGHFTLTERCYVLGIVRVSLQQCPSFHHWMARNEIMAAIQTWPPCHAKDIREGGSASWLVGQLASNDGGGDRFRATSPKSILKLCVKRCLPNGPPWFGLHNHHMFDP